MSNEERPGSGFVVLSGTDQRGVRAVLVVSDGNMALRMADGSTNQANPVAVTAGMFFPLQALSTTAANTATLLGVK